jgi:CubicO group peptidase (beta-lactamase class C family)
MIAAPAMARSLSGALPNVAISGGEVPASTRAAMERLSSFAAAKLAAWGLPGMALAFRVPDGSSLTAAIGLSQLDPPRPVRPEQLFHIGSITKSFVAVALLRLADRGLLDLDAPVLGFARPADRGPAGDHRAHPQPLGRTARQCAVLLQRK